MQDVQAQLLKAQRMIDSAKKSNPAIQAALDKYKGMQPGIQKKLDSVKKANPNAGDVNVPGVNDIDKMAATPNLDSIAKSMSANMATLNTMKTSGKQQLDKGLPQQNASSNFVALPNADSSLIIGIINSILPNATQQLKMLDPQMQKALDALIQDTTITPQAQGILMLSEKYPKYMAQYMICKGVLLNPNNPWAINDLGVILRNEQRNKEAAQCFKYAYSFNDSFFIIKTNMAWAVAYYGDFMNAKKYFHDIINVLPDYSSAWEGLGMIAYKEGDMATLFNCLAHQIKTIGAGGGSGPSDNFAGFCDAVMSQQQMNNIGNNQNTNPSDDHTFDNDNGEDGQNSDESPTGNSEPPNYPSMGGIFAQDIDHLMPLASKITEFVSTINKSIAQSQSNVAQKQNGLSRLSPPSYADEDGNIVTPKSFEKFYSIFHHIHENFEKRASYVYKQFDDDWDKLSKSIVAQQITFGENYIDALNKCKGTEQEVKACQHEVNCQFKPRARGQLGNDLSGISTLFTKYIKQMQEQIDWYVSASTPFIKRMPKQDWNTYMNAIREDDVRHSVLSMYEKWLPMQGLITNPMLVQVAQMDIVCTTPIRTIDAGGPSPDDLKVRKLKTFPDFCDRKDPENSTGFEFGPINYQSDCDHTKLAINIIHLEAGGKVGHKEGFGPVNTSGSAGISATADLGFVFEHVRSKKFKEDDYYNVGTSIALGIEASAKVGADGSKGWANGSSGAGVKASASVYAESGWRFSSDGDLMGRYKDVDVNVGVNGSAKAESNLSVPHYGDVDLAAAKKSFSGSAEVKYEAFAQVGSDGNYANYQTTNYKATTGH